MYEPEIIDLHVEFNQANDFAIGAHTGQKRKYTGEPYYDHLVEVMMLVRNNNVGDIEMQSASLLHDIIEDTDFTEKDLRHYFSRRIADIVMELTDTATLAEGNRATRSGWYKDQLEKASPAAQTIKCADIISNAKGIIEHDPNFAKVWLAEAEALLNVMLKANMDLHSGAWQIVTGNNESTYLEYFFREDDGTIGVFDERNFV